MLDFKALAGTWYSVEIAHILIPFPAYIIYILDASGTVWILNVAGTRSSSDGGGLSRCHHEREVCGLGSSTQAELRCRKLVPHVSLHHPPASVSTAPLPSLPPLPSPRHPPSTAHPSPATTRSPHTVHTTNNTHITKMHPAPWRRDNSNPSSCNPLSDHPLPYPHNHLKSTAMITCQRRAISSRS